MANNPFDDTNATLPGIYGTWNPMLYSRQMDNVGLSNQFNQGELQKQTLQNQFDAANNPLRVQQTGLQNQLTGAQIPGVAAQSNLSQDKAALSRATIGQQLEQAMAEHQGKLSDIQLKQISNAGQTYAQTGAMLSQLPGPARHAAARAVLGPLYHPEFDQMDPDALHEAVSTMGDFMNQASSKYILQQAGLGTKQQTAFGVADKEAAAKVQAAQVAAAARAKQYSEDYLAAKAKYGAYPQQSGYYRNQAMLLAHAAAEASDPADKTRLLALANDASAMDDAARKQEIAKAVAAGVEANRAKPNLNSLGIETVTPPNSTAQPQAPTPSPAPQTKPNGGPMRRKMTDAEYKGWLDLAKVSNPDMTEADIEREAVKRGYK